MYVRKKNPWLPMLSCHSAPFAILRHQISPTYSSICTPPHFRLAETSWKVYTQRTMIIFVNLFQCRKRCNNNSTTFTFLSDFGHTDFVKSLQHTDLPNWISTCLFLNEGTLWSGHRCLNSHSLSVPHTGTLEYLQTWPFFVAFNTYNGKGRLCLNRMRYF